MRNPGSSPSITTISQNGGYQIAFVSSEDMLFSAGTYGTHDLQVDTGIFGVSPSIAGIRGSQAAAIAFNGPGGDLWTAVVTPGSTVAGNTNQRMDNSSSPNTTTTG